MRLEPDAPEPIHDLGLALQASGRLEEALACFEKVLDVDPAFLSVRPQSREIVDRCRLASIRSEVAPARGALERGSGVAWAALDALGDAARRGPRVARRVRSPAWLFVAFAIGYLAFRVAPPYATHFRFQDRIREIARVPIRNDLEIHARLMREIEELGLAPFVPPEACEISTGTSFRTVVCRYRRPIRLLPGLAPEVTWRARVEVPVLFGPDPVFY